MLNNKYGKALWNYIKFIVDDLDVTIRGTAKGGSATTDENAGAVRSIGLDRDVIHHFDIGIVDGYVTRRRLSADSHTAKTAIDSSVAVYLYRRMGHAGVATPNSNAGARAAAPTGDGRIVAHRDIRARDVRKVRTADSDAGVSANRGVAIHRDVGIAWAAYEDPGSAAGCRDRSIGVNRDVADAGLRISTRGDDVHPVMRKAAGPSGY